ncbi:MAG TPA: acyl-CoA dehydrogenase family protein [Actinomycetota bacterium]|nr:acyl-CoA dehydrogenase family protein [Actinomycetota bacterium]
MEGHLFSLTPDQERLIADTMRLARDELVPLAKTGQPGTVNRPLVRALAEHGLLPRLFPERAGGTRRGNVSAVELCLLREGLAVECTEAETALALQALGAYPIVQAGTEDLGSRYVPAVARGEAVAAFALTEPEHGSDAAAIELRAVRDGYDYRLSGVKTFISNAPQADLYTVFARTTADAGARGVTAFLVPGDSPGLAGEPLRLLVPHAIGRLQFDGVRVPADHVLGRIDEGFRVAMRTLDLFRPSVGAFAVGMARAALDAAVAHATAREAFGRAISEFQAVSHAIAEMATRTEAARLLVYSAAAAHDEGRPGVRRTSAMAKLFATETAQWVVDAAIQVHGAAALADDHLLAKLYREVRAPRIYEGTSEIQREIIARELFG